LLVEVQYHYLDTVIL